MAKAQISDWKKSKKKTVHAKIYRLRIIYTRGPPFLEEDRHSHAFGLRHNNFSDIHTAIP